jgi:hypothetical protein
MLVCIYCGEMIDDDQLECCGENHFEEVDEEEYYED